MGLRPSDVAALAALRGEAGTIATIEKTLDQRETMLDVSNT
jgi:hypothetical protein